MKHVSISEDELYPYYTLHLTDDCAEHECMALTDAEYHDYKMSLANFEAWQNRLSQYLDGDSCS